MGNELKKVTNTKYNKLSDQKNVFTEKGKTLDEFYNETQNMMKDTTMDTTKRRSKILSQTKQLLSDKDMKLTPNTNDKIIININDINKILSKFGSVYDGNGALPPSIRAKEIKHDAATITIEADEEEKECIGHKLEYVAVSNGDVDDEKLEWKSITTKSVEYE